MSWFLAQSLDFNVTVAVKIAVDSTLGIYAHTSASSFLLTRTWEAAWRSGLNCRLSAVTVPWALLSASQITKYLTTIKSLNQVSTKHTQMKFYS